MRKILLFLSISFLIFLSIWALFGKSSDEFIRDVKIIIFTIILLADIIALIAIAIGEKDIVKYPFFTALLISLGSGFISGFLVFNHWFLVVVCIILYAFPIILLEYKKKTFSNKIYDKNDKNN